MNAHPTARPRPLRLALWVSLTLVAFAGNSLLCRLALKHTAIDPASFTAVRLVSGALMSGLGDALWYQVLPALKATQAATVQLAVPVIAALGAVALLGEPLTVTLILASGAILGGVALVVRP